MTKKHFIELADVVKATEPIKLNQKDARASVEHRQWEAMRDALAQFCANQNPRFMRESLARVHCGYKRTQRRKGEGASMNATKHTHTQGPWRIIWNYRSNTAEIETVRQDDGYRHLTNDLPMCCSRDNLSDLVMLTDPEDNRQYRYSGEAVANARLIAAAPELLDALMEILSFPPPLTDEKRKYAEVFKRAKAAIAKAQGAQ